jgi:hypothetical protein
LIPPESPEKYRRYPQVVRLCGQDHDLAQGGIAHQVVRNLDRDFHRGLGSAFISFSLALICLGFRPPNLAADFFGAANSGIADVAYLAAASRSPIGHCIASSHNSFGLPLLNQRIATPLGNDLQSIDGRVVNSIVNSLETWHAPSCIGAMTQGL